MPYPRRATERAAGALVGAGITVAGAWVLIRPPVSYEGLGDMLTTAWGVLLTIGGILVTAGWAARSYKIELPGIIPAMGGLAIYSILSWQAALGDSPGSGPRASIVTAVTIIALLRLVELVRTSRDARWAAEVNAG